jgi:hypothetical protein
VGIDAVKDEGSKYDRAADERCSNG